MKRGTLVVPNERARAVLHELGHQTRIQFADMNVQTMRRAYKTAVQRIEECERITRFLVEQVEQHNQDPDLASPIHRNADEFLATRPHYKFEEVEAELKRAYTQLLAARENHRGIIDQHSRILEEKYVVLVAASQSQQFGTRDSVRDMLVPTDGTTGISNAAGVIGRQEQDRFARALFRMSRGNTFTSFHPIADPINDETGKPSFRSVFVVYFQGGASSVMSEKVRGICNAYGGRLFDWPETSAEADQRFQELNAQLKDSQVSQSAYDRFHAAEMDTLLACPRHGGNSLIEDWRMALIVEKSIYSTLNNFEATEHTLKCDCWYAEMDEDHIRRVLIDESPPYGVSAMLIVDRAILHADPHGGPSPPTYIRGNGFTSFVQEICDTLGTPRYKEANPMLFTLVTFPFIFGVMFGDIGHGLLLLLAGTYCILKGPSLLKIPEYGKTIYEARYILFMMGFFALYAGFLYNDFLSIGLDLFGSRYKEGVPDERGMIEWTPIYDTTNSGGAGPYPFGLDPAWHGAQNQLLYVNSMKMKVAVLLGVFQMVVGVLLSFTNARYEGSNIDTFFVCLPQLIFMIMFFGYMDWMIVHKWTTPGNAPSIINSMISMGLGQTIPPQQELFEGQNSFHTFNMILLMICVPWMLIPKPALLYMQHQREQNAYHRVPNDDESQHSLDDAKTRAHAEFDFSEIVIHSVIETIEFVLGSISHTASYLRLWALSLAHQQLSLVFFQKTLLAAFATSGAVVSPISIFFGTAMFICVSCLVLMGMDVLECFLHTLRLHWVEFMSKFFKGDGNAFQPYSHQHVIEQNCS
jgi:V-type H+-transporting ATPase subunit a